MRPKQGGWSGIGGEVLGPEGGGAVGAIQPQKALQAAGCELSLRCFNGDPALLLDEVVPGPTGHDENGDQNQKSRRQTYTNAGGQSWHVQVGSYVGEVGPMVSCRLPNGLTVRGYSRN